MTVRICITLILINLTSSFSIYNGEACDPNNYTFLVQLIGHRKGKSTVKCSGTLIRLDTVITAAHCVLQFKRSIINEPKVILHISKGSITVGTKEIHIHSEYDKENLQYDIAILKLEEPFPPSKATTITLPQVTKNSTQCEKGTFLGWGRTKFLATDALPEPSNDTSLHCIDLPVISNDDCRSLRSLAKLQTFFCTFSGFNTPGGGCIGDSGGPFLCDGVQYGVVSVNFGCGVKGEPTYFTRIDKALDFIEGHVGSFAVYNGGVTIILRFRLLILIYYNLTVQ